MKFICNNADLINAAKIVQKALPSKSSVQILEHILIESDTDGIKMTANDNELGISTVVYAQVIEEGSIAVQGKLFIDIVSRLQNGDVIITVDDKLTMNIKSGRSQFNFPVKDGAEFYGLPKPEEGTIIEMNAKAFAYGVSKTAFCCLKDGSNPIMAGEYIEVKNNRMCFSALDGHRIAYREMYLGSDFGNVSAIIPSRSLNEVTKAIDTEDVSIEFCENHVKFYFGDSEAVIRKIEGEYFKFDNILKANYVTNVVVNADDFLKSMIRTSVVVREGDKKPAVFNIDDTNLNLSVKTNLGSVSDDLEIDKNGPDIRIGFNPRFLIDVLNNIEDEEVEFGLANPKSPAIFRKDDGRYIYVVLPVNIN